MTVTDLPSLDASGFCWIFGDGFTKEGQHEVEVVGWERTFDKIIKYCQEVREVGSLSPSLT